MIPHNQILWVWMRTGSLGFLAFWLMICAMIIRCCHLVRAKGADVEAKTLGIFTGQVIAMLIVFGLLDLQLVNFRDLLFTGFFLGVVAGMPFRNRPKDEPNDLALADAQDYRKRRYIDGRGRYVDQEEAIAVERRSWRPAALEKGRAPVMGTGSGKTRVVRNVATTLATQIFTWAMTFR